jgi:hypothetical protein
MRRLLRVQLIGGPLDGLEVVALESTSESKTQLMFPEYEDERVCGHHVYQQTAPARFEFQAFLPSREVPASDERPGSSA